MSRSRPVVDADWVQEHLSEPDLAPRRRSRSERARPRAPAAVDPARARLAAAAGRPRDRKGVLRWRCSGASGWHGSPARSASSSTTAVTAWRAAPPLPAPALCSRVTRTWPCSQAGRGLAGRARDGAIELEKSKPSLEPRARRRADLGGAPRPARRSAADDPRRPLGRRVPGHGATLRPAPGSHPWSASARGGAALRRTRTTAGAVGGAGFVGLPEGSEIVASRHSAPVPALAAWLFAPPGTTRATIRARGTSGRATATRRPSAERGPLARPRSIPERLALPRLGRLDLVRGHGGDVLADALERKPCWRGACTRRGVVLETRLEEGRELHRRA